MRLQILLLFFSIILGCTQPKQKINTLEVPEFMMGKFEDDYQVSYSISDSLFEMEDHTKLHILRWNIAEQYFVGQNDSLNPYDPLLYTRIDWMEFEDMDPFEWGFCMSSYKAVSLDSAIANTSTNREVPKTGCGGYPFSRMKQIE